MSKHEYLEVPNDLSRDMLINRFGAKAVRHYEQRLKERELLGKKYLNPLKTIYLFAEKDKASGQGFYSTFYINRSKKQKNHGGS